MKGFVFRNATRGSEMGQYGEGHSKQDIKQLINIERHMVLLFNASQASETKWLTNASQVELLLEQNLVSPKW